VVETGVHAAPVRFAGGGSFGEALFAGDGREHLAAAVSAAGVADVDEPGDRPPGLVLGGERVP
jgi:hypothetical protein